MTEFNHRVAALKPSATLAAETKAIELKESGVDVISLAAGEPDFDTPERVKEAARRAMAAGRTKYTPSGGTRELRETIRLKLQRENGLEYELGEVMASAGAKQAEANVIAALFDEGDEVIIPTPAWVSFFAMVQLSGAEPRALPCLERSGFVLDPGELRNTITARTKGIMINSPSNPTGAVYDEEALRAISKVLLEAGIWVMSDDVYERIAYNGRPPHLFTVEPRLKQHGIIFNSLSKTYAMTGWRIGYAAGPKEVIAAATRLQGQNSGNPNSIAQAAAVEALTGGQDEVAAMVAEFRARRDVVIDEVRRLPGLRLPNSPQGAFYAFPNISELLGRSYRGRTISDGDELAKLLLEEAHVAVVGGNDFGAPEYIRISYATSRENLVEAFKRIEPVTRQLLA